MAHLAQVLPQKADKMAIIARITLCNKGVIMSFLIFMTTAGQSTKLAKYVLISFVLAGCGGSKSHQKVDTSTTSQTGSTPQVDTSTNNQTGSSASSYVWGERYYCSFGRDLPPACPSGVKESDPCTAAQQKQICNTGKQASGGNLIALQCWDTSLGYVVDYECPVE